MWRNVIAFDVETIPDTEVLSSLFRGEDLLGMSEVEKREKLTDYHLKITDNKNPFHRQLFHRIVCLSMVVAKPCQDVVKEGYIISAIKTIGRDSGSSVEVAVPEKKIVSDFCSGLERICSGLDRMNGERPPRLVSFNGRNFDIPVIKYRAMKHGVSAAKLMSKDYSYRYSFDFNLDLLEALSDFGSSARVKLGEVCSMLKIPCKTDMDGGNVAVKYDEGKIQEIEEYCEIDSLVTFLVYIRYQVLEGTMSVDGYNKTIINIISYIDNSSSAHLVKFAKEWKAMGDILL